MKAIVLAGGFAKRMWPLTKNKPKQLLPVAGRPMLDHILSKLEDVPQLDQIFISTNAKFENQFKDYLDSLKTEKSISLFIEDTHSEGEKLGSVGALGFLIKEKNIDDDLLVVGGDNLFDFEMPELINDFLAREANIVALYDLGSLENAGLYGVVETSEERKIIGFEEKPENPNSALVSTACYVFTRQGVKNILRYLDEGNDPDKIGHFIEWLYKNDDVFGFVFKGKWFDIGSFESYDEANEYFTKKLA
jgi:glucose-1-phosphate thymidylyltransferase